MNYADCYRSELLTAFSFIDTSQIQKAIELFEAARENGNYVFTCGNGGSASTASHFACDIIKGASYNRNKRFRIIALTDQLPTLTAYANDVNYGSIFVEQLKNFASSGDLVMAISGSGNSPNVVRAVEYARSAGCRTIALTGRDGGQLGKLAELNIQVPVHHMGRIEDAHMAICHMIGYYFMEQSVDV